jgi:hypothetical protein
MHITHGGLENLATTAVGSLPLADTEHTTDDAISNSDSTDLTARRVHFAKCREVQVVSGMGPHFTQSTSHRVGRVAITQSGFESNRQRHRCHCGF